MLTALLMLDVFFFQRPKLSMNPFYKYDTPITSKAFDARVRAAARAYLS
jgi:hypothetical protein